MAGVCDTTVPPILPNNNTSLQPFSNNKIKTLIMKITKKFLADKINELDDNYQVLTETVGYLDPDTMYLKGHRDALIDLYNNYLD